MTIHLSGADFGELNPNALFSQSPRLTLRQTFQKIAPRIHPQAKVSFFKNAHGYAACILPYAHQEDPMLSFQFFSQYRSVVIRRIDAGKQKRSDLRLGSAMIASQYPFWKELGATSIALLAHEVSIPFYRKLGFEEVMHLPEYSYDEQSISNRMRLDLTDPVQRDTFEKALQKASHTALTDPKFGL